MSARHVYRALAVALSLTFVLTAAPTDAEAGGKGKWEFVSSSDGVRVYRKEVPGSSVMAFKGVMTANIHIGKVISAYANTKLRKDWVDKWAADAELDVRSATERVFWIRFGLPWPVTDRDYVLHLKAGFDHDKRVFTARLNSTNHAKKPKQDCCVRGRAFGTYYKFTAIPGTNKTKLFVEVHTDPKGMLPGWLVNIIQKDWPRKTLTRLVKRARKADIAVHPAVAVWHNPPQPKPVTPPATPAPTPAPAPAPTN